MRTRNAETLYRTYNIDIATPCIMYIYYDKSFLETGHLIGSFQRVTLQPAVYRRQSTLKQKMTYSHIPVSTGILPHSLPEWAFRARPGLWQIYLCPKVARIAEQKFGSR